MLYASSLRFIDEGGRLVAPNLTCDAERAIPSATLGKKPSCSKSVVEGLIFKQIR